MSRNRLECAGFGRRLETASYLVRQRETGKTRTIGICALLIRWCGSKFEPVDVEAAAALGALRGVGCHAFVCGLVCAGGGGVLAPDCAPRRAALLLALQQIRDGVGQKVLLGAFSFGVHGARPVVVGQDHPEVVRGGVFVAAAQRWMSAPEVGRECS